MMKRLADAFRPRVDAAGAVPTTLGKPMRWVLATTLVASAYAVIWPKDAVVEAQSPSPSMPAAASGNVREPVAGAVARPAEAPAPVRASAPAGEGRGRSFEILDARDAASASSAFDPFAGPVPPPPPPPVVHVEPAPAPAPPPPPMNYRFMGRVVGPDGASQVYLSRGDGAVPVVAGTTLEDGYVVESVTDDAVVLAIPARGVRVPIPAPSGAPAR